MSDKDGAEQNEGMGFIVNTCNSIGEGILGETAKVPVCGSDLENDIKIDKIENSNCYQNGEETNKRFNGNNDYNGFMIKSQVFKTEITRVGESLNGGLDLLESDIGKEVDEDGISFFSENLNNKLVEKCDEIEFEKVGKDVVGEDNRCDNGDKGLLIKTQVLETEITRVDESLNGGLDFLESDLARKVNKDGISVFSKNLNDKFVEKCDEIELGKAGKEGEKVVGDGFRCDNGDKGLAIKTQVLEAEITRADEGFRSANEHGRSSFLENGSDKKVDNIGTFLVYEKLNEKNLEKLDRVELKNNGKNVLYSVGDFVWSKFNSHPWWPGQIYDPSDASDHAKSFSQREKHLLVAYFGDGSFSWRLPSQLKPFAENFNELLKKSNLIEFSTAVQDALVEIGRVAELKMTCPCISEAERAALIKQPIVNYGIKKGVVGTECVFSRVPVSDFEPKKLLSDLKTIAEGKWVKSMLELTGLKSSLSAFYRFNGGRKLTIYHEGVGIEGLENQTRNGSDLPVMKKCVRKRKSVAKLMKENVVVEPNAEKKTKSIDKSLQSSMKKISSVEKAGDEGHEKAIEDNGDGVMEGEAGDATGSRKRKKSKYLSYPYTEIFISKKDVSAESLKISKIARVGERMNSAAAKLTQSSPILKKKLFEESDYGGDMSDLSGPYPQGEGQKKMIGPFKIKASPKEVVIHTRSAALDPQKLSDAHDMMLDFVSAYRSVVYKSGSNYKLPRKKRKSLSTKPGLGVKNQNEKHDLMMNIAELKGETKNRKKKGKIAREVTGNEGLTYIKQTLEKITLMVKNCEEGIVPEMKLALETEMKGLLEKISAMTNTASS